MTVIIAPLSHTANYLIMVISKYFYYWITQPTQQTKYSCCRLTLVDFKPVMGQTGKG